MNRHRACGPALAALCVALLVVPALFTVTPSPPSPAPADAQAPQDAVQDLGSLLAALPEPLSPATALGPAAHWLFPPEAGGAPAPPPSDVQGVFDMVRRDVPWDPMPIPDAPAGEEPLLAALEAHAGTAGFDLPDTALLRAQIASLRLVPEAEEALSQLVLAYDEAVRLEAAAVRDLTSGEVLLLGQQPDAVAAWLAEDPARTGTDFEALHRDLVARVDFSQRLRAADLLLRTIEQVKDPLALPPAPLPDASDAARATEAAVEDATGSAPAWPGTGDPGWDRVYALVGLGIDPTARALPDRPHESLPEALANLAATLGHPGDLPLEGIDRLPASLADAVATIVTARRVGLTSGDATVHSLLLLEATREAQPTLEAWAALLDLDVVTRPDRPDAVALLEAALAPDPLPSLLLARGRGLQVAAVPDPPALATLLEREGLPAADALAAAASLPAPVALGTAHALHGMQQFDARREQVLAPLDPATREALERHTATANVLLEAPSWTPEEADLVEAWARGMAQLSPDGLRALQQSQVDLLASVEAAVAVLGPYAAAVEAGALEDGLPGEGPSVPKADPDMPWYRRALSFLAGFQVVGTASAQVPPSPVQRDCTTLSSSNNVPALSDCGQDVWLRYEAQGRGILVTGFGSTTVRPGVVDGNPALVIDLGGGDTYRHPVGSADGLVTARVAIDLGGSDLYEPLPTRLAPGAAEGLGSLGVLWDAGGNDIHQHHCPDKDACVGAHGYGASGGVGVLLDGVGVDTYDAPGSRAHGVGVAGGTGLLLDLGDGKDTLHASGGQGHGSGTGSIGLLLNDGEGANRYATSLGNPHFQGGSAGSAVGVLVDLGGRGTFYRNPSIPEEARYHGFDEEARIRTDDALWADAGDGFGLGIDSTLQDEDGDDFPNLVELVAGSDPQDGTSRPGLGSVSDVVGTIQGFVEDPPDLDDLGVLLEDQVWRDDILCEDPTNTDPWRCMALLHIGGTADDAIERPAHILIELGGDDTYHAEVAGPGNFTLQGKAYPGVGSYALDLSGGDTYLTPPDGGATQGAVDVFGLDTSNIQEFGETDFISHTSILMDLSGTDNYVASELSQGAAWSRDCLAMNNPGAAWLVDLDGDDTYTSEARSQGYVGERAGRAGLVDVTGNDAYSFEMQAEAEAGLGFNLLGLACVSAREIHSIAMLFDGAGKDSYRSNIKLDAPPDVEKSADVDLVFSTQGVSQRDHLYGIFLDEGNNYDIYSMRFLPGRDIDVSQIKNNQTRHGGKDISEGTPDAQTPPGIFIDSAVWFGNHEDTDGDGASVAAEFVAGSDPNDPDDNPGSVWGSPERLGDLLVDPTGATGHLGLDGGGPALRIPGRLIIDGRGNSTYSEVSPFFVSLGGNNVYDAPNAGGAGGHDVVENVGNIDASGALGTVVLLLDAGDGDTAYVPQACTRTSVGAAGPVPTRVCPSLGGANNGIAIVADGGGKNTFHAVANVDLETGGERIFDLVTQGAAANRAVGALVTWTAENTFLAELTARLDKTPTGSPVELTLRGVAQGASVEGVGLLASLGGGSDTYQVRLVPVETATGDQEPSTRSLAQGAAWTDEQVPNSGVRGTRSVSYGLLLDDGGSNRFIARSGYAQGFAATSKDSRIPTMGLLWVGTGDDQYNAQRHSQGSTLVQGSSAIGLLYDAGGNDEYLILPSEDDGPAHSQGAGTGGVGLLLDLAGDDQYDAQATHAQGVAAGGAGILVDGGGHDRYSATGSSQGHASDDVSSSALFLDLHGHDRYQLGGGDGMGHADAGCALFVDAAGRDRYSGHPDADDDKTWMQSGGLCAAGVDSNALDAVPLGAVLAPGLNVGLEARSGPSTLEDGDKASGEILLRALVDTQADPDRIHRVSFLGNSGVLGHGEHEGTEGGSLVYEYLWDTTSTGFPEAYPDGTYRIWASVFLDTGLDAGAAGQPDLPAADSSSLDLLVDNPPMMTGGLGRLLVSPVQGPPAPLQVQLGRDLEWPVGVDGEALCGSLGVPSADCHPGANVRLTRATEDGTSHTILDTYRPAGKHTFDVTGLDGGTPWQDGRYDLAVEAEDAGGQQTLFPLPDPLLVDGTPPTSSIAIPAFANEDHALGGGSALRLAWEHSDGDGSGVDRVCVLRFADEEGRPADEGQTLQCLGPSQTTLDVDDVGTGSVLHFLTTAADKASNRESSCLPDESVPPGELCHLHKLDEEGVHTLTVDFDAPRITFGSLLVDGHEPKGAYVRPGAPVNFTVDVTDVGSGVGRVEIRLPGGHVAQMRTVDGGRFWYDGWGDHSSDLGAGREEPLIIAVTAFDRALNRQPELQTATLDDRAPIVIPQDTEYVEVEGGTERTLLAGRPGLYADARVRISDAALGSLTLDVGELTGVGDDLVPCDVEGPPADPNLKTCRVRIPPGAEDGDYRVWFNATDRAGNTNATESVLVEVRSQPLDLRDIRVASVGHDRFRVEWETEFDGTSVVHYGLTSEFGQSTALQGHRTEHAVEVTGLAPSSTYAFQVVSENTAGIPSRSAAFTLTTLNAYTFEVLALPDVPLRGVAEVGYRALFLDGDSPLQAILKVQDAAGAASPFEVTTVEVTPGIDAIAFDTRRFADGEYRFVLELDRAGDFLRVASPAFRIDNTEPVVLPVSPRPASTVAEAAPSFEVVLLDSMGTEPPVLSSLGVRVDGQEVPVQVESDEVAGPSSLQRRVVFTLPEELGQGPHDVEVSVSDRAGNVGRADWPLIVDTEAPVLDGDAEATPLPGPDAAKPGGRVHVAARLLDEARVASARLDLSVLQGTTTPLLSVDDRWEATVDVPIDAPHGTVQVPVVAVDGLGNEGVAGHVAVTVDAHLPRILQASVHNVTHTSAGIDVATDKPVRAWTGDGPAPTDGEWQTEHTFLVGGLAPGEDHAIALHVVDRAGSHVTQPLDVTTPDDDQAPGTVGGLSASSPAEGVVVLAWEPAADNAGIGHYRVERIAAPRAPAMEANLTHDATTMRDDQAPAGRTVTYRVTPVDVAGLEGPTSELVVEVLALPRLSNASITPGQGSSDKPFTFQVEYRHAGDRAADRVHVRVGDRTHALVRVDDADACHDGCLYRAAVRLPPSSLFGSASEARFEATTGGQQGTLAVTDLPFVRRAPGDDGIIDLSADGRAASGAGPLVLALLLAASAVLFRRRNHP